MHKHLTWTDRLKIEKALKEGVKPCKIADRLHVHNCLLYTSRLGGGIPLGKYEKGRGWLVAESERRTREVL